ncbi:MAG: hypothetical protein WCF31_05480, partial [Candidatus Deferrimicrobiaceae bacterium]
IREALKKGHRKEEKVQGVFRALKHVPGTKNPVAGSAGTAAGPVTSLPEDSGFSASAGARPGLVSR